MERMSYTAARSTQSNKIAKCKWILEPETTNRYKVAPIVEKTVNLENGIPFLRDFRDVSNQKFSKLQTWQPPSTLYNPAEFQVRGNKALREVKRRKIKELCWNSNFVPIS